MKKNIFWGIIFILSAILLILNALGIRFGLPENISVWKIVLCIGLVMWIIDQCVKKHFANIFFPLIFIVMLFEKEFATLLKIESGDIASTWVFLLIGLLLTAGFSLITKEAGFTFTYTVGDEKHVYTGKEAKEKYREFKEQKSVYYIDCSEPINKEISVNLGRADIYFSNVDLYDGNGKLKIENNMGKITVHLPNSWTPDCNIDNSLGSVKIPKPTEVGENLKRIKIIGDNNLGKIEVVYNASENIE